jgi:carbamoyl-phosphate synthase small subunit
MKGYVLLADGMRLDGVLVGPPRTAVGWLVANTAVVGFQEMVTDPAYKGTVLAFTYPEVGNVGAAQAFSESAQVQVEGLVVKVLSEYRSHYLSEKDFSEMLAQAEVPCLAGIDTRALAVHLRDAGEMPAAIAPADADASALKRTLVALQRPEWRPSRLSAVPPAEGGPRVAVISLGIRRSQLRQLGACCRVTMFGPEAEAGDILAVRPAGVFISDGPGVGLPPGEAVETIRALLGKVPMLGCGLGHVALGMALGCATGFLKRGHHGANYPVRHVVDGTVGVTEQRHTVVLDRASVLRSPRAALLYENVNDQTVEGIMTAGGLATGVQDTLAAPAPGLVNPVIRRFVGGLSSG